MPRSTPGAGRHLVERLSLAVPGLTETEARRLGEEVSRRLMEELGGRSAPRGRWDELRVSLEIPRGTPRHRLAALIAEQIARRIGAGGGGAGGAGTGGSGGRP